jgi:hypothetical protein
MAGGISPTSRPVNRRREQQMEPATGDSRLPLPISLSLSLSLSPFLLSHGGRICLSGARASLGKHASGKSPTSSTVSHLQPVFPSRAHPYGVHHPRLGTPTPFPASSTPRSPRWTPYWPWARHDGHPASPIALLPRIHLVDALKT